MPPSPRVERQLARLERETRQHVHEAVAEMLRAARNAVRGDTNPNPDEMRAAAQSAWARALQRFLGWLRERFTRLVTAKLRTLPDPPPEPVIEQRVDALAATYIRDVENRMRDVPAQVFDVLRRELADGYQRGETPHELRQRVARVLDLDEWGERASRIARTETTAAYGWASETTGQIAQQHLGVPLRREWVATNDERTRPAHRAADGQVVNAGERFRVGGELLRFPGDPLASPVNTVNCRCTTSAHVGDFGIDLSEIDMDEQAVTAEDTGLVALPTRMPPALLRYWTTGEGGTKIGWGRGGDFNRCRRNLRKYVTPGPKLNGLCQNLHMLVTGQPTGRHASLDADDELLECRCGSEQEPMSNDDVREMLLRVVDDPEMPEELRAELRAQLDTWDDDDDDEGRAEPAEFPDEDEPASDTDWELLGLAALATGTTRLPLAPRGREWDGDAAAERVAAWADGDPEKLDRAFFYRDLDANPRAVSSRKLGFADVIGGELKAVPRGIFAVAAVLQGSRGGVDIPDEDRDLIRRKVEQWYRRMAQEFNDPNLVPPWRAKTAAMAAAVAVWSDTETSAWFEDEDQAVVAAAAENAPENPPADWFQPIKVEAPTPPTVTTEGRFWGLIAQRGKCYSNVTDRCIPVPETSTNYGAWYTGTVISAEGDEIPVGYLYAGCQHSDTSGTLEQARQHLEAACRKVAAVRVYDSEFGPMAVGSILPGATAEDINAIARVSGEWFPAELELHAAVAVPQSAFPVDGSEAGRIKVAREEPALAAEDPRRDPVVIGDLADAVLAELRRREEHAKAGAVVTAAARARAAREINRYKTTRKG